MNRALVAFLQFRTHRFSTHSDKLPALGFWSAVPRQMGLAVFRSRPQWASGLSKNRPWNWQFRRRGDPFHGAIGPRNKLWTLEANPQGSPKAGPTT